MEDEHRNSDHQARDISQHLIVELLVNYLNGVAFGNGIGAIDEQMKNFVDEIDTAEHHDDAGNNGHDDEVLQNRVVFGSFHMWDEIREPSLTRIQLLNNIDAHLTAGSSDDAHSGIDVLGV